MKALLGLIQLLVVAAFLSVAVGLLARGIYEGVLFGWGLVG